MSSTVCLGGLGLDHHDRDVGLALVLDDAAGDDHVEDGALELGVRREADPLAVDQGDADAADRTAERDAGELRRHRCRVDRDDVVEVLRVERHDRLDDLDLVAQALGERRAQRPVDQPAGEDGVLAGTSLTTEERAGDPADGVHPLFDVDGQGKEVQVLFRALGRGGRRQHHRGVVEVGDSRAGCLAGETPGFELDDAVAERAVVDDGFARANFQTLHGSSSSLSLRRHPGSCRRGSVIDRGSRETCGARARGATTEDRRRTPTQMWARRLKR